MAYLSRTIRIEFPELGDDIWVSIHNPLLMPISKLQPDTDVKLNPDGTPTDPKAAIRGTFEIVAKLVLSWNVYDPMDTSEAPDPLPMPATPELVEKLPQLITMKINEIVGKALSPLNKIT